MADSNARRLAERLKKWSVIPASVSVMSFRADETGHWWPPCAEAVLWLVELEAAMELQPELLEAYDGVRDAVRSAVYSSRWALDSATASPRRVLEPAEVSAIAAIAAAAGAGSTALLAVSAELKDLRDAALLVREAVTSASDLAEDVRQYLLVLVGGFEQALTEAQIRGVADIRRLADELIGALARLFVYRDGEESKQAAGLMKVLARKTNEFLNSPLVAAVAGGFAGGVVGQITAG